ncbi:hypothetical protein Mal4_19350 [Maioricimonas rarisocia]|uniref:Zinc-finger domain-containing protein n=1 Tax=Maioricimonas rarisocia TaxID=2528026 RepID=A0A517Z556_9PLAN|nr:hypothetical protein [Maioricimonas rarisocia]QDU37620.1 hypothetical protein Mal4_19350 [Maioricimonas rarisocia]
MTTTSTNMNESLDHEWGQCPAGAVQGLVQKLRVRRRRRQAQKVVAVAGMLAIICVTAFLALPKRPYDPELAGLHCSEVLALADDLIAGRLDDLTRGQIVAHCRQCRKCHNKIVALRAAHEQSATPRSEPQADDRTARQQPAADLRWQLALYR